jgi:hypothetical protein
MKLKVTKLFGRCLSFQVGTQTIEVKVMGESATASPARELLLIALEASTGVELVEPATKGAK